MVCVRECVFIIFMIREENKLEKYDQTIKSQLKRFIRLKQSWTTLFYGPLHRHMVHIMHTEKGGERERDYDKISRSTYVK